MLFIPNKCKYKKFQKGKSFNKLSNNINLLDRSVISIKLISKEILELLIMLLDVSLDLQKGILTIIQKSKEQKETLML